MDNNDKYPSRSFDVVEIDTEFSLSSIQKLEVKIDICESNPDPDLDLLL